MNTAHFPLSAALAAAAAQTTARSVELFRHCTLTIKLYAPRGHDPQTPHTQDEIYVIASGSGQFFDGQQRIRVGPGDLLFAAAGQPHRFEDFTDGFATWVMFYGPDGGEAPRS
ncbi:MAG: cupin domain-containing protein [Gemmatimonadota bacterium]